MSPTTARIGHFLAKILFIDTNYRNEPKEDLTGSGGESIFSTTSADTFVEEEPTAAEWLRKTLIPSRARAARYIHSLFPFTAWIAHYNVQWLIGDLIAGEHLALSS